MEKMNNTDNSTLCLTVFETKVFSKITFISVYKYLFNSVCQEMGM